MSCAYIEYFQFCVGDVTQLVAASLYHDYANDGARTISVYFILH